MHIVDVMFGGASSLVVLRFSHIIINANLLDFFFFSSGHSRMERSLRDGSMIFSLLRGNEDDTQIDIAGCL